MCLYDTLLLIMTIFENISRDGAALANRPSATADADGDWRAAREAGRRLDEDWPVMRGSAAQRDARFVRKLLKAQLASLRKRA
jgi:hypothetical protein